MRVPKTTTYIRKAGTKHFRLLVPGEAVGNGDALKVKTEWNPGPKERRSSSLTQTRSGDYRRGHQFGRT
jgi:hypothetical protein